MIIYLVGSEGIVAAGVAEDHHHLAQLNAEVQEITEGEWWWLSEAQVEEDEALTITEMVGDLKRRLGLGDDTLLIFEEPAGWAQYMPDGEGDRYGALDA